MVTKLGQNNRGAASMIVVIFVAIILSIMTIGFIRIAVNEQRQSTDFDLSQRAYYAAESGLEDARRAVGQYLNDGTFNLNEDTCDAPNGYTGSLDSEFEIEYTCMLIDLTPAAYRAELDSANQTRQITVNPVDQNGVPQNANLQSITLEWHVNDTAPDGDGQLGGALNLRTSGDTTIPTRSNWSHPAMMELSFIAYPVNGIQTTDIIDTTLYLSPSNGGGSDRQVFNPGSPAPNLAVDGRVLDATCNPSASQGDYVCSATFTLTGFPSSHELALRLTNLYQPTTIEMSMQRNNGNPLYFADAQANVDVTGRSGSVYRRVEATLDLNHADLLPQFAIQSATDICKNFSFTDDPAEFGGSAPTSCN